MPHPGSRSSFLSLLALLASTSGCGGGEAGNAVSIAFATDVQAPDPVVVDYPLAYVSRALTLEEAATSRRPFEMDVFEPGAALMLKDRAEPSAPAINLLDVFEDDADRFDVRDLASDYDGSRLVFSMRGPFDETVEEQPTWNIWIYDLGRDELRRVIDSDTMAESGQDRDPHFLPDGRIVFSSNRQRRSRAILLDEGRPQFGALDEDRNEVAFVLHTMNDDGADITQISFNQSHDQDATVGDDGHIVFSRWDNVPGRDVISLYRMRPDGTELQRLYGYHSQQSGPDNERSLFLEPHALGDRLLVESVTGEGNIVTRLLRIDPANFADQDVPVFDNAGSVDSGQESMFATSLATAPSPTGRFVSASAVPDETGRILAAWSQCRLIETTETGQRIIPCSEEGLIAALPEAAPLYGLWMFDAAKQTQQPVVPPTEGTIITEAVVLGSRPRPPALFAGSPDAGTQTLIDAGMGILNIRSVYDMDGSDTSETGLSTLANPSLTPAAERPYRFIRLVKPVSLPSRDVRSIPGTAFGRSQGELMREILGYGVIHPDGSVRLQVPANVPFAISLLDAQGRRVTPRHRNWLQVRPGEVLQCRGCHEAGSQYPHGRPDAEAPSISPGAPWPGLAGSFAVATGDTMAEGFAELFDVPRLIPDLAFEDIWTDPDLRQPDASFTLAYGALATPLPTTQSCAADWRSNCRITIHYPDHIHPLWSVPRVRDDADVTCSGCHATADSLGATQVPAAQLDLGDGLSADQANHLTSYRELLFGDVEQELVNGALVDRLIPVLDGNGDIVIETDDEGTPILDADGNTIAVLTTVPVQPSMSTGGAASSSRFLSRFAAGSTHADYLSPAELRLIGEWLDVGAQYYNDPFAVPP